MGSTLKRFIKHLIRYNAFDYSNPYLRRFYRKIGLIDYMDKQAYWFMWKLVRMIKAKAFPGISTGKGNVPMKGAGIFVCNHSHLFDPFLSACHVFREVHWMSKIENYFIPFFKPLLQASGSIPVRRGQSDQNAIRMVREKLEAGKMVGMFPEGTRTKDGKLGRFHTGAARMCLEYGIPYVPTVVLNSYKCKIGDRIDVHIGNPRYPPKGIEANYENTKWFTDLIRKDIVDLLQKYDTNNTVEIPVDMQTPVMIPAQFRKLHAQQIQQIQE
ncbi:MAG: 1-acyl-sn-glycerol-3-phosphate acyltransferase [Promethearchaeota archaeon]|nr:MAG: 1-acyl-sn-glycerol-3-phosphate acyltransferase [Candidatus Lokiarchaeota archaeon]